MPLEEVVVEELWWLKLPLPLQVVCVRRTWGLALHGLRLVRVL